MRKTELNITRKVNKEKKKISLISNSLKKTRDNDFKLNAKKTSKTKTKRPISN